MTKKRSVYPGLPARSLFPKKLASLLSPHNNELVVMSYFNGPCLWASGIQQSGPYIEKMWEMVLKTTGVKNSPSVLVIGFGAGSVYKVLTKHYAPQRVIGIEIDPLIIEIGKAYFAIKPSPKLRLICGDAQEEIAKLQDKFDLIIIDLYKGGQNQLRAGVMELLPPRLTAAGVILSNLYDDPTPHGLPKNLKLNKTLRYKKNYLASIGHAS